MAEKIDSTDARGSRVLVIGGANTDIVGVCERRAAPHESNPGHVRTSAGGVAHNVAVNLARMGAEVVFVTAFGDDANATVLAGTCRLAGLDLAHSITIEGAVGSVYSAIVDPGGELVIAVSDMRTIEALTPAVVRAALGDAGPLDGVVIDANLAPETIRAVIDACDTIPVFADAVSMAKAPRLTDSLGRLSVLRVSAAEAEILTGVGEPSAAACALVERGAGTAWVSAGPHGTWWHGVDGAGFVPAPAVDVVNVTGAGDAFMAGVVFGTLAGWSGERVARFATGAAALTLASEETVSAQMSADGAAEAGERVVT